MKDNKFDEIFKFFFLDFRTDFIYLLPIKNKAEL